MLGKSTKNYKPRHIATNTKERRNAREGRKDISTLYDAMCHYCGENFPDVQSKDEHARGHSTNLGGGVTRCNECNEKFTPQRMFYRHFLKVHTGHGFVCLLKSCGKGFTDKKCTIDHHYNQHGLEEYSVQPRLYKRQSGSVNESDKAQSSATGKVIKKRPHSSVRKGTKPNKRPRAEAAVKSVNAPASSSTAGTERVNQKDGKLKDKGKHPMPHETTGRQDSTETPNLKEKKQHNHGTIKDGDGRHKAKLLKLAEKWNVSLKDSKECESNGKERKDMKISTSKTEDISKKTSTLVNGSDASQEKRPTNEVAQTASKHRARDFAKFYDHMCRFCGRRFLDIEAKNKHTKLHYSREKDSQVRCKTCDRVCSNRDKITAHFQRRHAGKNFFCLLKRCGKGFRDKEAVIDHHSRRHGYHEYKPSMAALSKKLSRQKEQAHFLLSTKRNVKTENVVTQKFAMNPDKTQDLNGVEAELPASVAKQVGDITKDAGKPDQHMHVSSSTGDVVTTLNTGHESSASEQTSTVDEDGRPNSQAVVRELLSNMVDKVDNKLQGEGGPSTCGCSFTGNQITDKLVNDTTNGSTYINDIAKEIVHDVLLRVGGKI